MGDRGNIEIKQPHAEDSVFLYTHWRGCQIKGILADALAKGGRWSDPSYLTRIIFQEMIGDNDTTTSFGISVGQPDDNEYPIPLVHWVEEDVIHDPGAAVPIPKRGPAKLTITLEGVDYTPEDFVARYAGVLDRYRVTN
tara:strand:+ start:280 stop:696 length:417 start_codon:yes stop_codon:yes gene_type:complete